MKKFALGGLAMAVCLGWSTGTASAAMIGYVGSAGWASTGSIGDLTGLCGGPACDTGFVNFNTGLLPDGMFITGKVREYVQGNGVNTTSAYLQVTDLLAINLGANIVNDTLFVASDVFSPSLPGPVGVGIFGSFQSNQGPGGDITGASVQAQMNYLTTDLISAAAGFALTGFSLTTPHPSVACVGCSPVLFWASTFGVDNVGGVKQLVGAINFSLKPGNAIFLPGSLIIEDNDNARITAETPEPATAAICGLALIGISSVVRRRRTQR